MKTFKEFLMEATNIANNQAYAASKGKYFSSSDGKTYKNYNDAAAARANRITQREVGRVVSNQNRYKNTVNSNVTGNKFYDPNKNGQLGMLNGRLSVKGPTGSVRNATGWEKYRWELNSGRRTSSRLGGSTSFRAGGGEAALRNARKTNPNITAPNIQAIGLDALRRREVTPNTAKGFDTAFASARKVGQKTFKWRGGTYTTDVAP